LLPAVFLLDDRLRAGGRRFLVAWAAVAALGLWVQVLGASFYWDHFIRVAQQAQEQWLGSVNRKGAFPPDRGGACDPCFEDLHGLNWLPPFAPIGGHAWLLRHVAAGDDWQHAEADAPWHRYTNLRLDIARTYGAARPDWWLLDFTGRLRPGGWLLLVFEAGGLLLSAVAWARFARKSRSSTPPG
jgi:hypothetical protein